MNIYSYTFQFTPTHGQTTRIPDVGFLFWKFLFKTLLFGGQYSILYICLVCIVLASFWFMFFLSFFAAQEERFCQAVKSLEFDRYLGPYNLSQYGEWKQLSSYLTKTIIKRIGILATRSAIYFKQLCCQLLLGFLHDCFLMVECLVLLTLHFHLL